MKPKIYLERVPARVVLRRRSRGRLMKIERQLCVAESWSGNFCNLDRDHDGDHAWLDRSGGRIGWMRQHVRAGRFNVCLDEACEICKAKS